MGDDLTTTTTLLESVHDKISKLLATTTTNGLTIRRRGRLGDHSQQRRLERDRALLRINVAQIR